jgi:hypothetical protein
VREKYFLEVLYYIFLASNTGNLPPWKKSRAKQASNNKSLLLLLGNFESDEIP